MENKIRVAICTQTNKEVEQIQEEDGTWLCLHNDEKTEQV